MDDACVSRYDDRVNRVRAGGADVFPPSRTTEGLSKRIDGNRGFMYRSSNTGSRTTMASIGLLGYY